MGDADWVNKLQSFLYYKFLPRFIDDPQKRFNYVQRDVFPYWERAFIHESVNLNTEQNYESMETLGDEIIKKNFYIYLQNKYPMLPSSAYGDFSTNYLSKPYMKKLSAQLGLGAYLRMDDTLGVTYSDLEDVFESTVAALYMVAEAVAKKEKELPNSPLPTGAGDEAIYKYIEYLFKNEDLDPKNPKNNPRGEIKDIFEMSDWEEGGGTRYEKLLKIDVPGERRKNYQIQVILTPEAVDYFVKNKNLSVSPGEVVVIGQATDYNKKVATFRAYEEAVETLKRYGITREVAKLSKQRRDASSSDDVLYNKALTKANRAGYTDILIYKPKAAGSVKGNLYILAGVKSDGNKDILGRFHTKDIGTEEKISPAVILYEQYTSF